MDNFFGLIMQFLHGLAAVVWIGGTLFYILVMKPTLQGAMPDSFIQYTRQMATAFKGWVSLSITLLLVTGISLTAWRLTSHDISLTYIAILAIKVLIATIMFIIVTRGSSSQGVANDETQQRPQSYLKATKVFSGPNLTLILGLMVFFLADALGMLVEIGAKAE